MVVGNVAMGLRLPGIANIVEQCRLPMVLDGFFQLNCRFTVEELRRDEGLLRT